MSFTVKKLPDKFLLSLKGFSVEPELLTKLANGKFDSAQSCFDDVIKLRDHVGKSADKVTPSEDRYSSGDVKKGSLAGDLYWALNVIVSAAYEKKNKESDKKFLEKIKKGHKASHALDELEKTDAQVCEHAAKAIEEKKVPAGQLQQMIDETIPDAAKLEPKQLRDSIAEVIRDANAKDLRGTLFLMGQLARAGGIKGLE